MQKYKEQKCSGPVNHWHSPPIYLINYSKGRTAISRDFFRVSPIRPAQLFQFAKTRRAMSEVIE